MIKRIECSDFRNELKAHGRGDNFSWDASQILFNYYDEIDADIELDIIGICCTWTEYDIDELRDAYNHIIDDNMTNDEFIQELECHTTVIQVTSDTFIIQEF